MDVTWACRSHGTTTRVPATLLQLKQLTKIRINRMIMPPATPAAFADAVARQSRPGTRRGRLNSGKDKVEAFKKLREAGEVRDGWRMASTTPRPRPMQPWAIAWARHEDRTCALETADVCLMADDLSTCRFAVGLKPASAHAHSGEPVHQSGRPVGTAGALRTILGLGIGPALRAHEGSTLVVCVTRSGCLPIGRDKVGRCVL